MKNILATFLSICLLGAFTSLSYAQDGYMVGSEARDFNLKNVDGKMVSLADYKSAKGFIVVFTCNHCPYSKLYEERIKTLNEMYYKKGFPVIAINPNDAIQQPEDSFEEMQKRASEKNFGFPYLSDPSQEIAKTYGASRTPHVFVISKQGGKNKIAYIGAIDNNHKSAKEASTKYVEDAVNALLEGKQVKETFTKAIGCTIKWKES